MKIKHFIIYQITNTINNKIYIGAHTTTNIDDGYMGSGVVIKKAIKKHGIENFKKIILFECNDIDELFQKESEIVTHEFIKRSDTYNATVGGRGSQMYNMVSVKDVNGDTLQVKRDDPRYISGELKHVTYNRVTVVDSQGNAFSLYKDDPRIQTENLINPWKDKKHTIESRNKISEYNKGRRTGNENVNYGKVYITNLDLEENKLVHKDELATYISQGWIRGRKYKFFK